MSGWEPDFIQNDSYEDHVPVNEDYECDIVQEIRNSYDNKLDARGKQLLEFCVTTKMRILNGRVFIYLLTISLLVLSNMSPFDCFA
jgi:hypothetical protein